MESPSVLGARSYYEELAALGLPSLPTGRSENSQSKEALTRGSLDDGSQEISLEPRRLEHWGPGPLGVGAAPQIDHLRGLREISHARVQAQPFVKCAYSELPSRTNTKPDKEVLLNQNGVAYADRISVASPDVRNPCTRVPTLKSKPELEGGQIREVSDDDSAGSLLDLRQRVTRMQCDTQSNSLHIAAILKLLTDMKLELHQNMTSILRCVEGEQTASKQRLHEDAEQNVSRELARPENVGEQVPQVPLQHFADDYAHCPNVEHIQVHTPAHARKFMQLPMTSRAIQTDGIEPSNAGSDVAPAMACVTCRDRVDTAFGHADSLSARHKRACVTADSKRFAEELTESWKCILQTSLEDVDKEMKDMMKNQMVVVMQNLVQELPKSAAPSFVPAHVSRSVHPSFDIAAIDTASACASPCSTGVRLSATHNFVDSTVEDLDLATRWSLRLHRKAQDLMGEIVGDCRASKAYVAEHEQQEELRLHYTVLQKIVEGTWYQSVMFLFVLTQAVGMGVEAQIRMRQHWKTYHDTSANNFPSPPSMWVMYWFNSVLNTVFIFDLVLRIGAWRMRFLCTKDRDTFWWNVFDSFLVVVAGIDFLPDDMSHGTEHLGVLRAVRLLRAARILRVIGFSTELKKMVMSLFGGMKQLFWVGSLLCLILYVFALLFMQGAADEISNMDRARLETMPSITAEWTGVLGNTPLILHNFSSVKISMIALFATITGGSEWLSLFGSLMISSDLYSWVSVGYVLFFVFGFLNIVTGMFVDRAAAAIAKADAEASERFQALKNHNVEHRVLELFGSCDGELFLDELVDVFKDAAIQEWLHTIGVDVSRNFSHVLAILLPREKDGCTARRFLKTLRMLRGEPTASDIQMLLFEIQRGFNIGSAYHKHLCRQQQRQHEELKRVCQLLNGIVQWLPAPQGSDVCV